MTTLSPTQPDILEVIADLSNDEVRTPPRLANDILDLLPENVWTDPTLRWLDPGCKTGVFLREATKRLLVGLEGAIPDCDERLRHILMNMIFGVPITELTALMSRRTLYCSKDAAGDRSIVRMPTSAGHLWFAPVAHAYAKGRCVECGASEGQMERGEGKERHAYAFIHAEGRRALGETFDMKFDVIVGNPPYQMDGGGGGTNATPLYNLFFEQARELNPKFIAMIFPSRWMAGGRGLDQFRQEMLGDARIRHLVDFPNAGEIFPGVDIKGGVSYLLWNRDEPGPCSVTLVRGADRHGPVERQLDEFDIFVRDSRALAILNKVRALDEATIESLVSGDTPFGLASNFTGYKAKAGATAPVRLYLNKSGKRIEGWMARDDVPRNEPMIDEWKVLVPKAGSDGGQRLPDVVLGRPLVAEPPSACTQTYLTIGPLPSERAAKSLASYLRTRFVRFLISIRKISQDAHRDTYAWVPVQSWNKTWMDEPLYEKYGITEEEQDYIREMIKDLPA